MWQLYHWLRILFQLDFWPISTSQLHNMTTVAVYNGISGLYLHTLKLCNVTAMPIEAIGGAYQTYSFQIDDILWKAYNYTRTDGREFWKISSIVVQVKVSVQSSDWYPSDYTCSWDFTSLGSERTAACSYWSSLGSVHQVPITAGWNEGSVEYEVWATLLHMETKCM